MKKYKKKNNEIKVWQFKGKAFDAPDWVELTKNLIEIEYEIIDGMKMSIMTYHGKADIYEGDYIIKELDQIYHCPRLLFNVFFEEV